MVRAHNKIFRACQDNPAGHSARTAKKRQTEKEMGGQHPGMDEHDTGRRHEEDGEARRMEGAGCQARRPNGPLKLRDRQGTARQSVITHTCFFFFETHGFT